MDKRKIVAALRAALAAELEVVRAAAAAAREGATHEEAKPENEYDTRALEQSYLAGAQAARAEALEAALAHAAAKNPPSFGEDDRCQLGAGVVVHDGEAERRYFICEVGGGTKLEVDGASWRVLTPGSPLGAALLQKRVGDVVEQVIRGEACELELIALV